MLRCEIFGESTEKISYSLLYSNEVLDQISVGKVIMKKLTAKECSDCKLSLSSVYSFILGGLLEEHPDSTGDFVCVSVSKMCVFCLSPKIVQQLITAAYNGSL